jgi:hypothetical protein
VAEVKGFIPRVQQPFWVGDYGFFEFEQNQSISFISKCLYKSGRMEKVHEKEKGYDMKEYKPKCPEVGYMKPHSISLQKKHESS